MAKPIKKQAWSKMDVFGLLNGISIWDSQYRELKYVRRPFDSNLDIRSKIYKQHDAPVDTSKQGLINAISHEFGFTPYNTSDKKIFELTYKPTPSGDSDTNDIFGYYKEPGSSTWNTMPQIWASGYTQAKESQLGFVVWQQDRYNNIDGVKNFTYSNVTEVLHNIPDRSEVRFIYYLTDFDEDNNRILIQFTDINNPNDSNDTRFTYRLAEKNPSLSEPLAYTLNDMPDNVYSGLYYDDEDKPKELLYTIKEHINTKFKHKWGTLTDRECIWDIHKLYGSGHIPHFYDAEAPDNMSWCTPTNNGTLSGVVAFSGYLGGVEESSDVLYPAELVESSGDGQEWYLRVYPGRFYIDGVPFYYFENPQKEYLTFVSGQANLPSGLTRGMYTTMALSGYYDNPCQGWSDPFLSGIYEDYNYPVGEAGEVCWTHVYRHRPYLPSEYDHTLSLKEGEYNIDFENNVIYSNTVTDATLIWDQVIQPSGITLNYDLNPLNEQNLTFEKFFLFLALDRN